MTYTGPWRDDADPVWRVVASRDSSENNCITQMQMVTAFGSDQATAATAAWSLSGDVSLFGDADASTGNGEFFVENAGAQVECRWNQMWVTITTADVTVSSSTLPTSVFAGGAFVDSAVVGVEWEPTNSPLAQELDVTLTHGSGATLAVAPGDAYAVHVTGNVAASYQPGLLTAAAIRGMYSPGAITVTTGGTWDTVTFTPDLPLTAGQSMGVTLLDPYTESGTVPAALDWYANRDYPLWATLRRQYRPRYRLIYATRVNTWVRTIQRGDKFIGAPRTIQNNSQQASLRNIGFR